MKSNSNFSGSFSSHFKTFNKVYTTSHPQFSPNENIYKRAIKVEDIDFEDLPKTKNPPRWNEKSFEEDPSGDDLDVPGSEDDDEQEAIGNEDEENNYYSLSQDEQREIEDDDE